MTIDMNRIVFYNSIICAFELEKGHLDIIVGHWLNLRDIMVTFLPFQGYRPALKSNEQIGMRISPPYDVIDNDYLKKLQSEPGNVTNLTLRPDEDKRYRGSRKILDEMISNNALKKDVDSFYLYEQTFMVNGEKKVRRGYVGRLKTEDYALGNIIPHEETFSKVKEDRLNLLRDMETHLESIFGIFEGFTPDLEESISRSAMLVYRFKDEDEVEHRFSRIGDEALIREMTLQLSDQKMLIADGHHRYETALNYSKENPSDELKSFVLTTLVSSKDEGLVILPTHRLIRSDIPEADVIAKIGKSMTLKEIGESYAEAHLSEWMMELVFKSKKVFLANPSKATEGLCKLDTYFAQETILNGIYGYNEGKCEVGYDADSESVMRKMAAGKYDLAIILNDPSLETIWDLSLQGKRMPKKTTFFFPKIWSGFVFYRMI